MCLILLSYGMHDRYPLILAANRDEFYERPSAAVSSWNGAPDVIAGKDLQRGGAWLGITKKGRIAMLTNYRERPPFGQKAPSRGWLVRDFLCGRYETEAYLEKVEAEKAAYNGFSLILGDRGHLFYTSNRGGTLELSPGLYGLSNRLLDTPWPKIKRGKEALKSLLSGSTNPHPEDIFRILADQTKSPDIGLPDTGVGLEWERILSSIFIKSPIYGTRSSSVIMIDRKNHVMFIERVFDSNPDPWMETEFEFRIDEK